VRELDAVLDTSAILCVLEDEPGADVVEELLTAAQAGADSAGRELCQPSGGLLQGASIGRATERQKTDYYGKVLAG
jgi:PIN domain nuclease of toxin-antitoxin system